MHRGPPHLINVKDLGMLLVADFSKSILCPMSFCAQISDGFFELKELLKVLLVPSCRFACLRPPILNRIQNLKISIIFNFEITWPSNPISLANWLIWLSPIHTFTAHGEESAFRGQKYQTWQIFSSRPCVAKFSRKLRRTREESWG